jgi:hypothetical protein
MNCYNRLVSLHQRGGNLPWLALGLEFEVVPPGACCFLGRRG